MPRECRHCEFWNGDREDQRGGQGDCRRNAPTMPPAGMGGDYWPQTWPTDWCGEFKPVDVTD